MKLHEIQCHFREIPHAVTEYRLRRRPRSSRIVLVVVLVLVLDTASNYHCTNFPFLVDEHEDEYEKDQIKSQVHALPAEPKSHPSVTTAGALNRIPCKSHETSVSFSIKLAAFQASGNARMKLHVAGTVNRLNVEHRKSNFERPILMALRLIYFKTSEPQNFEG